VIPAAMTLLALLTGLLMAGCEGWTVREGFFYMVGALLGLANPLTNVAPVLPVSLLIECICISIELALAGAIIGITASHPLMQKFQVLIEGERSGQIQVDDVEKGAEPSGPSEEGATPAYVAAARVAPVCLSPEALAPEVTSSADHDEEAKDPFPSAPANPIRKPPKRSIQNGASKASRKGQSKRVSAADLSVLQSLPVEGEDKYCHDLAAKGIEEVVGKKGSQIAIGFNTSDDEAEAIVG